MSPSSDHDLLGRLGCITIAADFESFQIREIGPAVEDVLGYSTEECLTKGFLLETLVHPDEVELFAAQLMDLFGAGHIEFDFRAIRKDGDILEVMAFLRSEEVDDLPGFRGILFEHRGGASSKAVSDDRLQLALDSADMGVWDWNLSEWTIFWSDQVYQLHGTTREEAGDLFENPEALLDRVHPEDLPTVQGIVLDALRSGSDYDIEYRFEVSGGMYRWIYVKGRIYSDEESGQPLRIAGTAQDITARKTAEIAAQRELKERKRAEEKLRRLAETLEERVHERTAALEQANRHLKQLVAERSRAQRELARMNRRLVQSNEELRQFAHVASHDLQEPLRKITTFADIVRAEHGDVLDEEGRYFLERLQQSAHRMTRLIEDLLQFARLNSRGPHFELIDLNRVLREVLADLEVRIQDVNASIDIGALPSIEADPTQMRRLFQNLISNALKFRREEVPPEINVSSSEVEDDKRDEAACRLIVRDNGIGFSEHYASRIFAPFQRLHREYEGTGIGLAICRRIVELHQGTIDVSSAPGQGATFIIDLPQRQPRSETDLADVENGAS